MDSGNARPFFDVCSAMFVSEYLSVVSRWARQQLRSGKQTSAEQRRLRQLVEAVEGLSGGLRCPPVNELPENVIRLSDYRPKRRAPKLSAHDKMMQFLDP